METNTQYVPIDALQLNGSEEAKDSTRLRKRYRKPNPKKPLPDPFHEALAQFAATPRTHREFKSLHLLADHFGISRMTAHRHGQRPEVLERVRYLVSNCELSGELQIKVEWPAILRGQAKAAKAGSTPAARFCQTILGGKHAEGKKKKSSILDLLGELLKEEENVTPAENGTRART